MIFFVFKNTHEIHEITNLDSLDTLEFYNVTNIGIIENVLNFSRILIYNL